MSRFRRALVAIAGWCAVAAAGLAQDPPILFHGGTIVLNDEKGRVVEALLARNGKVVAAGTYKELAARPDAREAVREDLKGAVAVPGLQDAHGDLRALALRREAVDLSDAAAFEEVIARVRARAEKLKAGTWIRGFGWNEARWTTPVYPHHFLLSAAVPAHPVFLERAGGGVVLVNQAALQAAKLEGVFEPELKIPGGRMLLDEAQRSSGILLDAAADLVERCIPEPDGSARATAFLGAQADLLSRGITCVHDMGTSRATIALLDDLWRHRKLLVRVVCYLDLKGDVKADTLAGLPRTPDAFDVLAVPGVRIVVDGSLAARGAALVEEYADEKGQRGRLYLSEEELNTRLAAVSRAGLQPAVQATGDRANRMVLDAFSRMGVAVTGFRDLRPRIEHAAVVTPKDWPRFPELGVIPSFSPARALNDFEWLGARLGAERAREVNAWRVLAPALGRSAFGSDFPFEKPDPLRGLFAARARHALDFGEEPAAIGTSLAGTQALAGFTSGAAYAAFQDDRRGRLEPGFACDMTILDVDPLSAEPEALLSGSVRATVVNGAIVWRAR